MATTLADYDLNTGLGLTDTFKQPETEEEIAMVQFGVEGCPTEGVGKDGDQFDWNTTPISDWNEIAKRYHTDVSFESKAPVAPVQWG